MKKALVIGHDHVAGIEHLGDDLERRGFVLERLTVVGEDRFTRPDVTVDFPDPHRFDLVVTLGAPWPRRAVEGWARREVEFLARRHDAGRPVLALSFGAQLLSEALGGGVTTLPAPRIGWYPVVPSCAGVGPGPWFVWNGDQLLAPPGAELLACSDDGAEAFRHGRSVGLQFHPEMTAALLQRWLALPGLAPPDLDVRRLRQETARYGPAAAVAARALLDLL